MAWLKSALLAALASSLADSTTSAEPIDFDISAPLFSCEDAPVSATTNPETMISLGISTLDAGLTILLKPLPAATTDVGTGRMCVFSRWTSSLASKDLGEGFYMPLGKSFDGNDWQRPPGKGGREVSYQCGTAANSGTNFAAGEYLCQATLPMTSSIDEEGILIELDVPYYLTYYERTLSLRNQISRFLHTTTFGPTDEEITALEVAFNAINADPSLTHGEAMEQLMVEWTEAQMDPSTFSTGKFSSLREYFRKRLNPRGFETTRDGEYGPHPCEADSRYRKFAFAQYDVDYSAGLKYGDLDSSTVSQTGHRITVETVELADATPVPTNAPTVAGEPTSEAPTVTHSTFPSVSAAPIGPNILAYGDMEGTSDSTIRAAWPSRCSRAVTSDLSLVYEGSKAMSITGGNCYIYRQMGGSCPSSRILDTVLYGDTLRIRFRVRIAAPGTFQVYTAHRDGSKSPVWGSPDDSSHRVSRTYVDVADEYVEITAIHTVDADWTYDGVALTPGNCAHYQLRFEVADSTANFYLDAVHIEKIDPLPPSLITRGFLKNPAFALDHMYYQASQLSGHIAYDPSYGSNVMVLKGAELIQQDVQLVATPGMHHKVSFDIKIVNMASATLKVQLRIRFLNNDLVNGPCGSSICNFYETPMNEVVVQDGQKWQRVSSAVFTMFDWSSWDGTVDFVAFTIREEGGSIPSGAEVRIADIDTTDGSEAPSSSIAPSPAPTAAQVGYVLRYAGEVRTVMYAPFRLEDGTELPMDGSVDYELCKVDEAEGALADYPNRMGVVYGGSCVNVQGGNPTVNLDDRFVNVADLNVLDLSALPSTDLISIDEQRNLDSVLLLKTPVGDEGVCGALPSPYDNDSRGTTSGIPNRFAPDKPVFAQLSDGTYALHDPRLILHENTDDSPHLDGGGSIALRSAEETTAAYEASMVDGAYKISNGQNIALCMNGEPNFMNEDKCVLSFEENACVTNANDFEEVRHVVKFDMTTMASMHGVTSKYIMAADNLRYDDTNNATLVLPCMLDINPRSRWVPRTDLDVNTCTNTLQAATTAALRSALESSNDANVQMRDITLWSKSGNGCDPADETAYGMLVMTDDGCFENVHPDHMNIYDFSGHVATNSTSDPLSVASFAASGVLQYSDTQPMSYFEDMKDDSTLTNYIGRYGDIMDIDDFATITGLNADQATLEAVANSLASTVVATQMNLNRNGGVLVCGSVNEVAPDVTHDDFFDVKIEDTDCVGCIDSYENYENIKQTVWTMNALEGEDQLCQRMAWALYQHLNAAPPDHEDGLTESNLFQYDIFTRNCFGSYFDMLKETVFSPAFGEQFSYSESSSTRYIKDTQGVLVYPDENMGREIMQLFTIGMHELNLDGSHVRDEFDELVMTYDNIDIMSNARIFTGFMYSKRRGNAEALYRRTKSRMEPMTVSDNRHDFLPKSALGGGWVGDRYPLCSDLPMRHFLSNGATFKFLGGSSKPRNHDLHEFWVNVNDMDQRKQFVLSPDSDLFDQLCNPNVSGECQFANTVTLTQNLPCYDKECLVDTVVVVQVAPGAFYEYHRPACVHNTFFADGTKVVADGGYRYDHAMCADPRTEVAGTMCCGDHGVDDAMAVYCYKSQYHGETVKAQTNIEICTGDGLTVCDPESHHPHDSLFSTAGFNSGDASGNLFFWTNDSCTQKVKVRGDGGIAVVHEVSDRPNGGSTTPITIVPSVDVDNTQSYFNLPWTRDPYTGELIFPKSANSCDTGACTALGDECVCSATVSDTFVFGETPAREIALESLKIGAFDPTEYSNYALLETISDVETHVLMPDNTIGATTTIFKLVDEIGETVFLKNIKSEVIIGGTYEFQNPVSFIDPVKVEKRDVLYEIDAFLKHLIAHPSAAPFICKKLVQFMGVSNPSPIYLESVISAFISGSFTSRETNFGDGTYGNLAAVAAAIVLNRESTSTVIDMDPSSGNIREPLLKLIQVMRSLEFQRRPDVSFRYGFFRSLGEDIGQAVFQPPNQFSFFSSDFTPTGSFDLIEMVSPESQTLSMASVVGFTNGMFDLVHYGLAYGYGGRGFGPYLTSGPAIGDYSGSVGTLSYLATGADVESKVDDLASLLTAGRLGPDSRQLLINAYNDFDASHDSDIASRVLLELILTVPEFHATNTVKKSGADRVMSPPSPPADTSYKAIVFIHLFGGLDSFNILAPHPEGGCPLYDDYVLARGGIGLTEADMDAIDASSAGIADCSKLGVHKALSEYTSIYNQNKGIFLANTGHLSKTVTKSNWMYETKTDLFSHSTMKREAHKVDAFHEAAGPGVLGRMTDILEAEGFSVASTSLDSRSQMVDGDPGTGRLPDVIPSKGIPKLLEREFLKDNDQQMRDHLNALHGAATDGSGLLGDLYSQTFIDVWNKTDTLHDTLGEISVASFSGPDTDKIQEKLEMVAKLIAARDLRGSGINRDVFYVEVGGFDSHAGVLDLLDLKLPALNSAIANFWTELGNQGMQNAVTVVQGSEFGRTITPNSNEGSDHAWGGNYFVFGGEVAGGKVLGNYPASFQDADPTNIGRGRLLPTTSWDAVWYGIGLWFGVPNARDMSSVLPNSDNFGCDLFSDQTLYTTGTSSNVRGCGGPTETATFDFVMDDPRFLTGSEQKKICGLARRIAVRRINTVDSVADVRCHVSNQRIVATVIKGKDVAAVQGDAVLNFDASVTKITNGVSKAIAREASELAAEFVVQGAGTLESVPPTMSPSIV